LFLILFRALYDIKAVLTAFPQAVDGHDFLPAAAQRPAAKPASVSGGGGRGIGFIWVSVVCHD
jgi:hypothetical protein